MKVPNYYLLFIYSHCYLNQCPRMNRSVGHFQNLGKSIPLIATDITTNREQKVVDTIAFLCKGVSCK